MRTIAVLLLLPLALASGPLRGEEAAEGSEFEVFSAPTGLPDPPRYPAVRQRQGREGWVSVNFMVDPEGRPYEVTVVDSIGDAAFERAAIEAVERTTFTPARLGDRPIDAGRTLLMTFQLTGGELEARRSFVARYRGVLAAVSEGDRGKAEGLLEEMDAQNLYEHAYLNLARYSAAARWGDEAAQLAALRRATRHEGDIRYLPDEVLRRALQTKFALEVSLQHYSAALATWDELQDIGLPDEAQAALGAIVDEILTLKDDDRSFAVAGRVGGSASWFHRLLKNRFSIEVTSGELAELKLRCDRHYVLFRHRPDMEYRIADDHGRCGLEVVGDPGSTFTLVQR